MGFLEEVVFTSVRRSQQGEAVPAVKLKAFHEHYQSWE